MVDDQLDLVGDEATTGKSLGTDLEQQKLTLPLIRLLSQLDEGRRRDAVGLLQGPGDLRRETLAGWLQDSDALTYSRGVAAECARQARAELDCLAPSDARSVLSKLTEFVVERRL